MLLKTVTSLAFAAACLTTIATLPPAQAQARNWNGGDELVTNGPQQDMGDRAPSWSARQNVIQSKHYDQLVESNAAFRHARMRKECGPITDAQLHANCIASFGQDEPMMSGSSMGTHHYRSNYGR